MANGLKYFRANIYKYYASDISGGVVQVAANKVVFIPFQDPNIQLTYSSSAYIMNNGLFTSYYDIFSEAIPDYGSLTAFGVINSVSDCMKENFPAVQFYSETDSKRTTIIENAENGFCLGMQGVYRNLDDCLHNRNNLVSSLYISLPFILGNTNIFYPLTYSSVDGNDIPNIFNIIEMLASDTSLGGRIITRNRNVISNPKDVLAYQTMFYGIKDVETTSDDPYSGLDGETDISGGGVGSIPIPSLPPASATATGIIGLFTPTEAQMQALASFMWTDFGGTGMTLEQIASEIVEALKRSISNPLDYIVGLNIIPSQGLSVGDMSTVRFGFVSSGISMRRLNSQYFIVDCGSVTFSPLCGNTFLDYAPYSKFSIYLPYIGVQQLDANDCVGHTIGLVYHGDVVTGGVTAYVTKDGSVLYQFSGSCALSIPLTADGWGSTIGAAVQIATSVVTSGHGTGVAGATASMAKGASSVASNPSLLSPEVRRSGAVSGSAGCMGVQYPYIIREAVRFHSTAYFNTVSGYPSFYFKKFEDLKGFTVVYECHLNDIGNATKDEIAEIESLLKEGVEF